MRTVLLLLLSSMLCWQLSALDGPKNHPIKPPGYLSIFMPTVFDSTAFPVSVTNAKAQLKDTLVCVDVLSVNFDTISALQYTVKFDTSILQFKRIKIDPDSALTDLKVDDFNLQPDSGAISLVYARPDSAAGLTIPDSTTLYQICFKPLKVGTSAITFSTTDTTLVLSPNGANREFEGEAGSIEITTDTITPPPPPPCRDTVISRTIAVCRGPIGTDTTTLVTAGGCDSTIIVHRVRATSTAPKDTLIYATICEGQSYTVGENVFRQAGTYVVNLLTEGGCDSTVQLALAVKRSNIVITGIDSSICDGDSTLVRISGGSGFVWSNGATTDSLYLGPGTYTVVIQDTIGNCGGARTVVIDSSSPKPVIESDTIRACSAANLPTITVSADSSFTVNWYDVPTGGTPIATDTLSFTPSRADTFYVEAIDSSGASCASTERTPIYVVIDSTQTLGFTVCPEDITTVAAVGDSSVVVMWTAPTFSSGCGDSTNVVLSSNFEPGDTLPVGTTRIRYVLTDSTSNTVVDSCLFSIIVGMSTDTTTPPVVDSLTFYIDTTGVTLTDSTISVPVKVRNFDAVMGFQFSLSIPDSLATFVGFSSDTTVLRGIDNFAFSSTVRTVNWFDPLANGVTLADSTTIFTLRISRDSASTTCVPIQFKNEPSKIIATKASLTEIIPTTIDGVVCPDTTVTPPIDTTDGPVSITGRIYREDSTGVKFVTVNITPDSLDAVTTNANGEYAFDSLAVDQTYTIRPSLDSNHIGGVNILDVVLIQRHILGRDTLDSPYKWIAADVNRSGSITVADILNIRRLILGALDSFPNNTSWRFVPASFDFPDSASNPLTVAFPDSITLTGAQADSVNTDFIGIKVGDVNLSSDAQLRAEETMEITMANRAFGYGEKLVVEVRARDLAKYAGYQFDLGFDRDVLEFVSMEAGDVPGVDRNAFNLNAVEEGRIPTLWYQTGATLRTVENPVLFRLTFNTREAGEVAQAIWLNQQGLAGMAVNQVGQAQAVKARFTDTALKVDLGNKAIKALGVQPNPFSDQALIRFKLPTDSRTTLSIIDAAGREVFREARNLSAGVQEWTIDGNTLGQNGVYHYRILTAYGVLTDKVILTK